MVSVVSQGNVSKRKFASLTNNVPAFDAFMSKRADLQLVGQYGFDTITLFLDGWIQLSYISRAKWENPIVQLQITGLFLNTLSLL